MSLFWEPTQGETHKPEVYEWEEIPAIIVHCGFCKVRINSIPDKYGCVTCPNGHKNVRPKN